VIPAEILRHGSHTAYDYTDTPAGACYEHPDRDWLFFDHSAADADLALELARRICAPCPIRDACLEAAIAGKEEGIWAGTTEEQRRAIVRGRSGVVVGVTCRNMHDLTLPNSTDRGGKCRICRAERERARAKAQKEAS
jgi:WhiB family redox-sensing transcriptional regulator